MTTSTLLANREFWLMTIVFGVPLTGMIGLVTNLVPIARDRGIELATATLLISALSLGSLTGKLAFAVLADRLPAKLILMFGVCGFFVGMCCFLAPHWGFGILAAGAAIVGFTNGGAVPLQVVVCASTFGVANVGRAVGLLNTVIVLAGLLAPPGFGLIYDRTGSYQAAFILYLLLAVAAFAMVLLMRRSAVPRAATAAA
jgi:cyanate permease